MSVAQSGLETSMSSKSSNRTQTSFKQELIKGQSKFIDRIFPLIDNLTTVNFPKILSLIVMFWFYLQQFIASIWPFHEFYDDIEDQTVATIYHYIYLIINFFDCTDPPLQPPPIFYVCVAFFALSIIWLIIELITFHSQHKFAKWALYFDKFIFDIMSLLLLLPCTSLLSSTIVLLYDTGESMYAGFFVICVVMVFWFLILFYISTLEAKGIIITKNIFYTFDQSLVFYLMLINFLGMILSAAVKIFPSWVSIVIIVFHLVAFVILLTHAVYMPFHQFYDNAIFTAILCSGILSDVILFIFTFNINWPRYIPILIDLIVFVVAAIVWGFIYKNKVKSIKKQLSANAFQASEIKDAGDYYLALGLARNENKDIMYTHIGIQEACDLYLDGSLHNFLLKNQPSIKVVAALLQMLSFFPAEIRRLNILFSTLTMKRGLNYGQRFLIYQVYRIKTMRQSAETKDGLETMTTLKSERVQCENEVRAFWSLTNPKITYTEKLSDNNERVKALFDEAVKNNPNNSGIAFEYSLFLSECYGNFEQAIYQFQKSEMAIAGTNFNIDASYRSFIRRFPKYLKENILDTQGKRIIRNDKSANQSSKQTTSYSSGTGGMSTNGNGSMSIDAELEENIATKIFNNAKMRLALHHAIEDRTSNYHGKLLFAGILILIIVLVVFIGLFIYMDITFESRLGWISRLDRIMNVKFYADNALLLAFIKFADDTGRFAGNSILGDVSAVDVGLTSYVDLTSDFSPQILQGVHRAKYYLSDVLDRLTLLAAEGVNVYDMVTTLLNEETTLIYCRNAEFLGSKDASLRNKVTYMSYLLSLLAGKSSLSGLFQDNDHCEIISNFFDLNNGTTQVLNSIQQSQAEEHDTLNLILMILQIAVPVIVFATCFCPSIILIACFLKEMDNALTILANLPPETKEAAKKSTRIDNDSNDNINAQTADKIPKIYLILMIYLILTALILMFSVLFGSEMRSANDKADKLCDWFRLAAGRTITSGQAIVDVLEVVILNGSADTQNSYITREDFIANAQNDIQTIEEAHSLLLQGGDGHESCYGFDDQLDRDHFSDRCTIDGSPQTQHDVYRCASMNQQVSIMKEMMETIISNPDLYNGQMTDETTVNLIHLLATHLWQIMFDINTRMIDLTNSNYNDMVTVITIYMTISIVLGVVSLCFTLFTMGAMTRVYQTMLMLVKRVPPIGIVASKDLLGFLLNKKHDNTDKSMSISQSIIHNSSEAIIFTNNNLIVEIVNQTVSQILGYTPNQMLGQDLTSICKPDDAEKIKSQVDLMLAGQISTTYEDNIILLSDASTEVPFHVTIIGMNEENSQHKVDSLVFILRDETQLIKQQKEAEEAKAKSEKLLFQILPRDIVVRLNRGEKDISFSIQHATIFFIDIVKFSDYSAALTPQDIMDHLSQVFMGFDQVVAKYPIITKIKLIGDVYMAAAGLFSDPEASPTIHAEDTIKCTLECLKVIEDVNIKLNSSLEVRIGVNTGGPLISGVLGTDKPVFDIIGDPINIASRLQSTDIPGFIQISQATKEYIENSGFFIEERGEVYLKGKGKQMTYFVHPPSTILRLTTSGSFV